jgi:hypothetical protein
VSACIREQRVVAVDDEQLLLALRAVGVSRRTRRTINRATTCHRLRRPVNAVQVTSATWAWEISSPVSGSSIGCG